MKHTPGPWSVDPDSPNKFKVVTNRRYGGVIAETTAWWVDTQTARANAKLIAAAPDLLEAVERLHSYIIHIEGAEPSGLRYVDALNLAQDAITKATE